MYYPEAHQRSWELVELAESDENKRARRYSGEDSISMYACMLDVGAKCVCIAFTIYILFNVQEERLLAGFGFKHGGNMHCVIRGTRFSKITPRGHLACRIALRL